MGNLLEWVLTTTVTVVIILLGLVYKNIMSKFDELKKSSEKALATKVDGIEYVIKNKWQDEKYGDLQISIKELRAANDESHKAIMIELKSANDILKRHS